MPTVPEPTVGFRSASFIAVRYSYRCARILENRILEDRSAVVLLLNG